MHAGQESDVAVIDMGCYIQLYVLPFGTSVVSSLVCVLSVPEVYVFRALLSAYTS